MNGYSTYADVYTGNIHPWSFYSPNHNSNTSNYRMYMKCRGIRKPQIDILHLTWTCMCFAFKTGHAGYFYCHPQIYLIQFHRTSTIEINTERKAKHFTYLVYSCITDIINCKQQFSAYRHGSVWVLKLIY